MQAFAPKPLLPGGTIGLIAPGSPPTDVSKIDRGIAWLESRGYNVVKGESVYAEMGYLSGGDDIRTRDINTKFKDNSIDAIMCTRGGYGCTRLLPYLDYECVRSNPKPLMGFSDITALHNAVYAKTGLITYAGPMVAVEMQGDISPETEKRMWKALSGDMEEHTVEIAKTLGYSRIGQATGTLLGGNMAVFMSLMGTEYIPDIKGAILLLEDIAEPVYKVDRMLSQLKNAGVLDTLSGVLLGAFTEIPENDPDRELHEVFQEYLEPLAIPVMDGVPFGHVAEKITLPIGAALTMDVESRRLGFSVSA